MANDLEKAFDSLPGWALPATIGAVVLVALFSRNSSGSSPHYNSVVYGPTPSDPGLISLAENEVNARQSVVQTLINGIISRDVSGIQADENVTISHINASSADARTRAAEALGIVQSNNQTSASIAEAQSRAAIARTNVAGATSQAHIAAKEQGFNSIVNQIGNVISKLNPLHW